MRSTRGGRWLGAVLAVGLLSAATLAFARDTDRKAGSPFHWKGQVEAGDVLEIRGVNGRIDVDPASGNEAVVEAEKWARRGNADRVRIKVRNLGDRIVIRTRSRDWLLFDDDVIVNFKVRVPRGVRLKLSTVNGTIVARDLENRVRARTVNGAIRIDTSEEAVARTVNGSITARAVPRHGGMSFRTINGNVRLELPSQASARLEAHTFHGSITSDFPARHKSGFLGRRLRGTLGDGDAEVEVSTLNGSIRFARI